MGFRAKKIVITGIVALFSLVAFIPYYVTFIMGTHTSESLYREIHWLPGNESARNLTIIIEAGFMKFYWNSFYVAVITAVLSVLVSLAAGYAFAKFSFKGNKVLFTIVMMTMMIPIQIGMVGTVIEMRTLGWLGTHLPIIIPFIPSAFGVFWMRQYAMSFLPTEVIESARIDGSGEFRTFFAIAIPMCKSAVITLLLLSFVMSWNSYLMPLVLINKRELYTIPLALASLTSLYENNLASQIMAVTIGTIPMLILFAFGSKYFIRGLSAGAVKG